MPVINRKNKLFSIDIEHIKPEHRQTSTLNGLYAAIYDEFRGAATNEKYKDLTPLEKMQTLNSFAEKWLREKGFYNE